MYRIHREGTFAVSGLVADEQCGGVGQKAFRFMVEIEADKLDSRGFICDNFDMVKMWERFETGTWKASCEAFAGAGIYLAKALTQNRASRIVCRIAPMSDAWIEYDWKRGDKMPALHPVRLDSATKPIRAR
jgi:hypothetical protein